ncbi:MAG: hypothetical protein ACLGI5_07455 [Thermoleophilia bacterium]
MTESAADAAVAALPAGGGRVEVFGDGDLARALRARLAQPTDPTDPTDPTARPSAIIETTGDHEALQRALQRVADLGTVVLAGPPPAGAVALDLYSDVHVRGLTIVGTPGPAAATPP